MFVFALLTSCANTSSRIESKPPYPSAPAKDITTQSTTQPTDESTTRSTQSASDGGGYVCTNPQSYLGKIVGDGHCVSLIKHCSKAPNTIDWRPGKRVLKQAANSIAPGTIIATFKNGRYPSRRGYHAAIYIKHDEHGIWVWDQWRGKAVHKRLIRTRRDKTYSSNSAQDYRLVKRIAN